MDVQGSHICDHLYLSSAVKERPHACMDLCCHVNPNSASPRAPSMQTLPKPKCRDTDPNNPRYTLSSASAPPHAAASRDQIREVLHPEAVPAAGLRTVPATPRQQQQQRQDALPPRDSIGVADIAGTKSKALVSAEVVSNFKLDASDIEGTWPGWKPPFRCVVKHDLSVISCEGIIL